VEYTVWKDGKQIGQTDLELQAGKRRRAGVFRPSRHGVTVLPGICAMLPALMAFGDMCQREGIQTDNFTSDGNRFRFEEFVETPEGRAVAEAAKHFADVELRDARGQTVRWEVLMISDVDEVRTLATERAIPTPGDPSANAEPMYIISVTFPNRLRLTPDRFGPRDAPIAVC
jgi:hypothetical protein